MTNLDFEVPAETPPPLTLPDRLPPRLVAVWRHARRVPTSVYLTAPAVPVWGILVTLRGIPEWFALVMVSAAYVIAGAVYNVPRMMDLEVDELAHLDDEAREAYLYEAGRAAALERAELGLELKDPEREAV